MVFQDHGADFFDQFLEADRFVGIRMEGDAVELRLDPGHPVELFEELDRRQPVRRVTAVGSPNRPERITRALGSTRLIAGLVSSSSFA